MDTNVTDIGRRLTLRIESFFRLRSIKGKIFTLFALSLLCITALTMQNFWSLSTLSAQLLLSERYDDLLNNILEVRRFEKNFLIYGDSSSLREGLDYLDRIDNLIDAMATDLEPLAGTEAFTSFRSKISDYRRLAEQIGKGEHSAPEELRDLGKTITENADRFRAAKRTRIHATISRTSFLPFAFFFILLPVMSLVIWLVSHGLLRPLDLIADTTRQVARGDFSPIHYDGVRLAEINGLIDAFNRMAHELEANQEDLIQARKIAAIGTFTAGIAHELNNPINNIVLTAETFAEEYRPSMTDSCQEMIEDIVAQAERAAEIVRSLLDFSRTEDPAFTRLAPELILTSSVKLVQNQAKMAQVTLRTELAPGLLQVRGNLGNLQQVFTNLLMNGLQVSPPGSQILFAARPSTTDGFVEFAVTDSGPGVSPDIRHQIFEPFFSTKEVGKGTGLGLSVCYSLVKRHGGIIKLSGEAGEGASFTVLLPVYPTPPQQDFIAWTAS